MCKRTSGDKGSLPGTGSGDEIFKNIKIIDSEKIINLTSMTEAIDAMEKAFSSYSAGRSKVPQRNVSNISEAGMDLFFKPAYDESLGRIAVKILTQKKKGIQAGIPAILGVVLLLDMETGSILAMIEGSYFTALRTGAASGIATRLLSREDSETIAVFGCGAQGRTQLESVCAVRPINKAFLYDLNLKAAEDMKHEMEKKLNIPVFIEKNINKLKQADIICTATSANAPLFFMENISKGVHINAIGSYKPDMQEIDPLIIKSGTLVVDSISSALKEPGDLIKPIRDGIFNEKIINVEIGDLINRNLKGRRTDNDVTIFKSVGLGVQDLFMADMIYKKFSRI